MISIRFVLAIPEVNSLPSLTTTSPLGTSSQPSSLSEDEQHRLVCSVSLISVTLNLSLVDTKEEALINDNSIDDNTNSADDNDNNDNTSNEEFDKSSKEISDTNLTITTSLPYDANLETPLLSPPSSPIATIPITLTLTPTLPSISISPSTNISSKTTAPTITETIQKTTLNPLNLNTLSPSSSPSPSPLSSPSSSFPSPLILDVPLTEPEFIKIVKQSLKDPKCVSLCEEGVGGTYFIHDSKNNKIAVFKPMDEEPGSPFNPKKPITKPLLPPGGGAKREVAAYLLDKGFAGVPETYLLENVDHPAFVNGLKSGSLQKFVENIGDSSGMGPSRFSVSDVHSIGILDLRLFNMDRNGENILVQKVTNPLSSPHSTTSTNCNTTTTNSLTPFVPIRPVRSVSQCSPFNVNTSNTSNSTPTTRINRAISNPSPPSNQTYRLIPIDHTYTLPPTLDGAWFEWQYWKQAKEPFSDDHLNYIKNIDPANDAKILRSLGVEEQSIRTMMISSWLLKIGAEAKMNLFEIAEMVTRKKKNEESILETTVREVERKMKKIMEDGNNADGRKEGTSTMEGGEKNMKKTNGIKTEEFIKEFIKLATEVVEKRKNKSNHQPRI